MHRVELAPRARRELQRALESGPDRQDGRRGPAASPSRPERLKGPLYRLRAGRYRIVYAVLDREQLVVALKVALSPWREFDAVHWCRAWPGSRRG